jgi:ABC-type dipeptide/oligopeptide/nickel transport system permease subunit
MTVQTRAAPTVTDLAAPQKGTSLWKDAWRRLLRNQAAIAGMVFGVILLVCALFADTALIVAIPNALGADLDVQPLLTPYPFNRGDSKCNRVGPALVPASQQADCTQDIERYGNFPHLMGTDRLGWDVFSRIIWGTRISLTVGIVGSLTALLIGTVYGAISGYVGGRIDNYMMRFVDVMYGIPFLLFVILIMVVLPSENAVQGMINIFIAIGVIGWMTMARLIRGQFLSLREKEFIEAAHMVGARPLTIIFRHLFPNSLGPAIVALTLNIPNLILLEAVLSFIGLGVPPPYPSWGQMVNEGWRGLRATPHLTIFPGLAITFTIMAFNFLGDGLRDALDPMMRGTS